MRFKVFTLLVVSLLVATASPLSALRFSIGGFGGLNLPLAQDDAKSGAVYGFKGRLTLTPFIAVDPHYTYAKNGDGEVKVEENGWNQMMTRDGGKLKSFGVDLTFGSIMGMAGFHAYGILGISSSKFEKKAIPEISEMAYWGGLGLEYSLSDQISLDFRAKAIILPYESGKDKGSRKNAVLTAGVNYYFDLGGAGK